MKYQRALAYLSTYGTTLGYLTQDTELTESVITLTNELQELVDKATPKKVDLSCDTLACPYCETGRIYDWENEKRFKYCADCGQALDWRKND